MYTCMVFSFSIFRLLFNFIHWKFLIRINSVLIYFLGEVRDRSSQNCFYQNTLQLGDWFRCLPQGKQTGQKVT